MKIIILTEGGKNFGFGHITRCIGLYQWLTRERNMQPEIIINGDKTIKPLLRGIKHKLFDWILQKEKLSNSIRDAEAVVRFIFGKFRYL